MPEWLTLLVLVIGLPSFMLVLESRVHRWVPDWRLGKYNDATGIMLSSAAVVYSVAMGMCVVTLWESRNEARAATEAEAVNLAGLAEGARVCDPAVRQTIETGVLTYNRDVIAMWSNRVHSEPTPKVGADLDSLVLVVSQITPTTEAQRAFVQEAVRRLSTATELRAKAIRLAHEEQLPNVLWISVFTGSIVVLSLCVTCGIRDGLLRRVLVAGVAATIGVNMFLAIELNYPFEGSVRLGPDSYQEVVDQLEQRR
ncbi:hypothetical protein Apa02nite_057730 [Actinoplanes palleronii]|uniref:DUF4239 domain-containing protein n=1 Tax=Actinoplanes palleronii TaxID=113570 RepID=A0ABQ4BG51_9ACTN|nr:hypothetical protein Apa02nite_057730 [Actinoplanes palleronii]